MENVSFTGNAASAPVESTTNWMITLLITSIPFVGFVMLLVWAFGSDNNPNRSNYAKAVLLWMLIVSAIMIVITAIFGVAIFSGFANY